MRKYIVFAVLLALSVGIYFSFFSKTIFIFPAQKPESRLELVKLFEKSFPPIQNHIRKYEPIYYEPFAGIRWHGPSNVEFLSENIFLAKYEDGHTQQAALFRYNPNFSSFTILEIIESGGGVVSSSPEGYLKYKSDETLERIRKTYTQLGFPKSFIKVDYNSKPIIKYPDWTEVSKSVVGFI